MGIKVGLAVGTGVGVICSRISRSESLKTMFEKNANISVPDSFELLPAYDRPRKESPETPFRVYPSEALPPAPFTYRVIVPDVAYEMLSTALFVAVPKSVNVLVP